MIEPPGTVVRAAGTCEPSARITGVTNVVVKAREFELSSCEEFLNAMP